ncbi:hypothetical protein F5880DRAFT_1511091, partial [Lentinula raphanica]
MDFGEQLLGLVDKDEEMPVAGQCIGKISVEKARSETKSASYISDAMLGPGSFCICEALSAQSSDWAIAGEVHPSYQMHRLGLVDECILVPAKNVLSAMNVQHNCVDCKCPVTHNATQRLEREIVKEKSLAVQH